MHVGVFASTRCRNFVLAIAKLQHFEERLAVLGRFEKRFLGKVDAVVFGDEADGGRREFSGEGTDAHRSENRTAGGEVTLEGSI